jgi:hypothetical protein
VEEEDVMGEVDLIWKHPHPLSSSTTSSSDTEEVDLNKTNNLIHPSTIPSSSSSSSTTEVVPMTIDTCEDLWTRLHDIRINGSVSLILMIVLDSGCHYQVFFCIVQVLEYTGHGKSIYDNGLAQSNAPLTPINHYYEVKILHPGDSCYIAIGLARKDYPSHKHPGWSRGSIAYHADDGKIFIGSKFLE